MTTHEKETLLITINSLLEYLDDNAKKNNTIITYTVKHTIERRKKLIDNFIDRSSFSTSAIAEQIKEIDLFEGTTLAPKTTAPNALAESSSKTITMPTIEATHQDYDQIKANLKVISTLLMEETLN